MQTKALPTTTNGLRSCPFPRLYGSRFYDHLILAPNKSTIGVPVGVVGGRYELEKISVRWVMKPVIVGSGKRARCKRSRYGCATA